MSETILLRADASDTIGAGHVMRMIALGQMIQDIGLQVCFLTATRSKEILARLHSEDFTVRSLEGQAAVDRGAELDCVVGLGRDHAVDWIVLDGYQFDTPYQQHIKDSGFRLMCVDDIAGVHFVADLVLNQNIRAKRQAYSAEPYTQFCIGPQHVLLRREFRQAKRPPKPGEGRIHKIAVSMGAIDSGNVTGQVLDCLAGMEGCNFRVKAIVGALNPHYQEIVQRCRHLSPAVDLVRNAGPELADIFQWADLVISAAGTTIFEALYMRAGLICHQAADNQAVNDLSKDTGTTPGEMMDIVDALNSGGKRFYAVDGIEVGLFDPAVLAPVR